MTRRLNHQTRRLLRPKTRFGRNVSFSQRHTPRTFKPNLQWVTVQVGSKRVRLQLTARQIRTLTKETSSNKLLSRLRKIVER